MTLFGLVQVCIAPMMMDSSLYILWEELSQVRAKWPMAWCLVGDFNIIKYPSGLAVSLLALLCSHSRIL